jgi:MATE family multidrug resistance protein
MRLLPDRTLSRRVWRLAGPVVVGMVSQTLMNVVDTAMVGRLGSSALAATGLGGVLSWMIMGSLGSVHVGTQAVSARRYGEGRPWEAGRALDNAILLSLIIGSLGSFLLAPLVSSMMPLFTNDPVVITDGKGYVYLRILGVLPFMVIMAHRGFFNGIGETHQFMVISILMNIINAGLNWVLIFGHFGLPAMGPRGAALGSTLGTVIGMLIFAGVGLGHRRRREYRYYHLANLSRNMARKILSLTIPSGSRSLLVMLGFATFSGIVARLGTVEMATTNVILNIVSLSYMPGFGFGIAAASLIGQKLGEGDPDAAEEYGWEAGRLGVITMGVMGILFIGAPEFLMRIFTDDLAVIEAGALPLRLMGFVQIFDALGMVLGGGLEGAGMTKWVFVAELIVNWLIFLPFAYLAAHVFGWGLTGAWIAFGSYLILFGTVVTIKFSSGTWKTVSV